MTGCAIHGGPSDCVPDPPPFPSYEVSFYLFLTIFVSNTFVAYGLRPKDVDYLSYVAFEECSGNRFYVADEHGDL